MVLQALEEKITKHWDNFVGHCILPSKLGEIWAADIAILPLSRKGNRYLLVIMEYLSKWVFTAALPSFDSDHVAQVLLFEVVLKIGLPERLITDNGANFISDAMKSVCQRLGIKRSLTSVESPQTDGLVERMNRTLKVSLAMVVNNEPQIWDEYLQFVTFAYNTAKQASSGYSPFNVLYGREVILPLNNELRINPKTYETEPWVNYLNKYIPILHGKAITNIKRAQEAQKKFYDKGTTIKRDYKVGDLIARKNLEKSSFPKERWTGPWVITKTNNTDGTSWKIIKKGDPYQYETTANIRHMRPWFPQDQQEDKLIQGSMKLKWADHLLRGKQCKDLKVRPNQMMATSKDDTST
ncbi:hypothetical protein G6F43_010677 [Rhizopus delemar]|nr:hypothetical protein G6F43_010677 [Rhizopus delemar]